MIKNISIFMLSCFLFFTVQVVAQTQITGKIIDSLTLEPVPFSLVQLVKGKATSVSNADGDFTISVLAENLSDTLIISNLGYQSVKLSVANATKNSGKTFYLTARAIDLQEVTVNPVVITELLKVAIKTSSDKMQQPVMLSGYYREVVKTDTSISKYADGLLDYYIERDKKNRIDVAAVVKQSRVKELKLEDEDKFDGLESKIPITRLAEFISPSTSFILDSNQFSNYEYKLRETEGERSILIVSFQPKPNSSMPLYKGTILIDKTTDLILGINYAFYPTTNVKTIKSLSMLGIKLNLTDRRTIVKYSMEKDKYFPVYIFVSGKISIESKKLNQTNELKSEFITSDYSDHSQTKPRELFNKKYLYQNGNKFSSDFWKSLKINPNTLQEENFLKD